MKKRQTSNQNVLIAFSSYFASKRAAKFGVFFIVFGTTFLLPLDSADAAYTGAVQVVCATTTGEQRTFTPSWDNSNQFFADKGQISRLFCEGGYAGNYRVFVSNNLSNTALDYYNGILPAPTAPSHTETPTVSVSDTMTPTSQPETSTVVAESETPTSVSDSSTAQTQPVTSDSPTATNQSQNPDTSTVSTTSESASVVSPSVRDDSSTTEAVTDSQTVALETSTSVSDSVTVTPPVQSPEQNQPIEPQPSPSPSPAPSVSEPVSVVAEPVQVQPQPVPDPAPVTDTLEPEPQEQPAPDPQPVEPVDTAPAEPDPVVSEPVSNPENPAPAVSEPDPVQDVDPIVEPLPVAPSPAPYSEPIQVFQPSQSPVSVNDVDVATLPPETPVELENGVILTAEVVVALQLLENPTELLGAIFTNPAQALTALSNIGADMSPEVREKSEKVVVSAIIAGGIATQAAGLAAASTYRRNP